MRRLVALLLLAAATGCSATTGPSLALAVELDATTLTRAVVTVSGLPGATTVIVRALGTQIRQAERADGERGACVVSPDGATATCAITLTAAGPVGIDVRLAPVCVPIAVTTSAPGAVSASAFGGILADRCKVEPAQAAEAVAPIATWLDHERVRITWTGTPCVLTKRPSAGTLMLCSPDGVVVLPDDVAERDTLARPQEGDRYCLAPGPPVCSAGLGARPAREWVLWMPVIFN